MSISGIMLTVGIISYATMMSEKTVLANVTNYDSETKCVTINTKEDGTLTFSATSFFVGEFAPCPKVGDILNIIFRPWNRQIYEAWHHTP